MSKTEPLIRLLEPGDIPEIAQAFQQLGWNKPASQYERYRMEQEWGVRAVFVAFAEERFAGYLTIYWVSTYAPFGKEKIPEIVDFNVLPKYRRQGIGSALMDRAENEIVKVSPVAGLGVGLTPDYGAAQRLYILRGYVPDGRGMYHRNHYPVDGEHVLVDDDLAIFLTKELK